MKKFILSILIVEVSISALAGCAPGPPLPDLFGGGMAFLELIILGLIVLVVGILWKEYNNN